MKTVVLKMPQFEERCVEIRKPWRRRSWPNLVREGVVGKWGKLCGGEKRLTNDAEVEVVAHLGLGPNLALVPPGVAQPDRSERERREREE